jgi:Uncharacterized protein conserved in bacteria (DUF2332)
VQLAEIYQRFGEFEVHDQSPCYRDWALGVADDPELLALIDELPGLKRQPQLVFAAARWAGVGSVGETPYPRFRAELIGSWPAVRQVVLSRRTQTNEPGRCAAMLPLLAALPQPLALLEVGAAAGLCLYPDRYSYRYGAALPLHPESGPSPLTLTCAVNAAVPVPTRLPQVLWRAGIDLNPLDVTDSADLRWLEMLIWPGQDHRRNRLSAAADIARSDPARIVRGDLNDELEALARQAPAEATLVVFHSAVMTYLDPAGRSAFVAAVRQLPGHWLSLEGPSVAPLGGGELPPSPDPTRTLFVLELDGEPFAFAGGQGESLHWFSTARPRRGVPRGRRRTPRAILNDNRPAADH